MAYIQNSELYKEIQQGSRMPATDYPPTQLADKVVPVMEVNPRLLKSCNIVRSTFLVAPTTIYTVPAGKEFYIVSGYAQVSDKEGNTAQRIITITVDGQSQILCEAQTKSVAATGGSAVSVSVNPAFPIKVDKLSSVVVSGAEQYGSAGIIGYTVDNPNA